MEAQIRQMIIDAEMVLIGIGEEFEQEKQFRRNQEYIKMRTVAEAIGKDWLVPALNRYFLLEQDGREENRALSGLRFLAGLIKDKNYFVITATTNDLVYDCGFREDRIVAPCGGSRKKQCSVRECEEVPVLLNQEEKMAIAEWMKSGKGTESMLGSCPVCKSPMILNNIYTEQYREEGYLGQWQVYTKWLQGTLNRRLCILELGVGMQCPGVIRFPFEKIGFYNQKASFIRVHENLYQLTEELKEKGISIPKNSVDWIASL